MYAPAVVCPGAVDRTQALFTRAVSAAITVNDDAVASSAHANSDTTILKMNFTAQPLSSNTRKRELFQLVHTHASAHCYNHAFS
jgi:hypothetical protein